MQSLSCDTAGKEREREKEENQLRRCYFAVVCFMKKKQINPGEKESVTSECNWGGTKKQANEERVQRKRSAREGGDTAKRSQRHMQLFLFTWEMDFFLYQDTLLAKRREAKSNDSSWREFCYSFSAKMQVTINERKSERYTVWPSLARHLTQLLSNTLKCFLHQHSLRDREYNGTRRQWVASWWVSLVYSKQ